MTRTGRYYFRPITRWSAPLLLPPPTRSREALTTSCGAWIDTAGRLDETRPIFFVRFAETLSGPQVARQPLTVGALLELRAFAAEIATFSAWLTQQTSEQQLVANTLFKRDRLATFYDPASTIYTAAAHLLSNCSKENEFAVVCALGARLAFLCLNAVPKTFERVTLPRIFKAHFTPPRLGGFRRSGEREFLFACLAHHIEEHHFRASSLNLDDLLKAVGLISAGAVYDQAERWVEQRAMRAPPLQNGELRRIRGQLLDFGIAHFRAGLTRSGDPLCMQGFLQRDLPSPSMMTSDCEQFNVTSKGMSIADSDLLNAVNIRRGGRDPDGAAGWPRAGFRIQRLCLLTELLTEGSQMRNAVASRHNPGCARHFPRALDNDARGRPSTRPA